MRFLPLFAMVLLILVSCDQEEPTPTPTTPLGADHITFSGELDSMPIALDTFALPQLYKIRTYEDFLIREVDLLFWIDGLTFDQINDTTAGTARSFGLSTLIEYSYTELDNEGNLPPLTASRLAQSINNGSYQWNDGSEVKEMHFTYWEDGYGLSFTGGNNFNIVNPVVHATASGNRILIQGSVDTLSVHNYSWDEVFATDFHFDYQVQLP